MAALKLAALALIVGVGLGWGDRAHLLAERRAAVPGGWPSWIVLGLVPVLFSFGGAYHGTYIAGWVRDPERNVPRGIVAGVLAVLAGYVGVNVAYLGVLGHDGLAASSSPAAEATALALGPLAGKALATVIVLSAAGILNTVCLGFPFVVYAMARDGLFFERAGRLDERTLRPTFAVALQGSLACAAVLVGSSRVDVLLTGIAFADALFQAAVAIVHLRVRRWPAPPGALRAPAAAAWAFLAVEPSWGSAASCARRASRPTARPCSSPASSRGGSWGARDEGLVAARSSWRPPDPPRRRRARGDRARRRRALDARHAGDPRRVPGGGRDRRD